MLTPQNFTIGDVISFQLYPSAILGTGFQNVKLLAILDMNTLPLLGYDPQALHANVYSTLPQGTPNDPSQYSYLKLLLQNGQTTVIGIPWIIDSSLQVSSTSSIQFTVNNVSPSDQNTILQALAAAGYTAVNMKVVTQT